MIWVPTSDCPRVIVVPVAPVLHVYVTVPIPSASASVLLAVRTWSSVGVPDMVTSPVGGLFPLATTLVAALVTLSAVPCPSV